MSQNVWPVDFGILTEQTPVGILREQGVGLGQRTGNIVVGQVTSSGGGGGKFRHYFSLYCSPLSYQIPFLYVDHDISLYPVAIVIEGEGGEPIHATNADEFYERLKEIFAREKTKKMIASLIAQSKQ